MSISNRKVVIVGAGHVGSHVGYALISQSLADEIVYIDSDHAKAVAQAFDLTDATNYLPVRTKVPWCVFTTKTQFYFEVNTHQDGLMFFDLLKICYPCYIPYRVFCDFSNKAVKDTNTLPVGSARPSNR